MTSTVAMRERIMQHLAARFEAVREGEDDMSQQWNMVVRRPLSKAEVAEGNCLGLFDTKESKDREIGFERASLTVVVEFYYKMMLGDNPGTELNRLLVDVQRTVSGDIKCGGLTLNIVENRNELDVDGPADSIVAGMCEFTVLYRHRMGDPRN